MPLTILTVAYPIAPMGMDAVGGAEQIAAILDVAIVRAGHRSLVIAPEGSSCQGELLATPPPLEPLDARASSAAHAAHREALRRALSGGRVDVVHLHGLDFDRYLPAAGPPSLVTLHLPPSFYDPAVFQRARPDVHFCCVSEDQARRCPPSVAPLAVIPNGVPLGVEQGQARGAPQRGRFALALGRVCPEKGFHLAIDAAARAQIPLILAGEVFAYEAHRRYFAEEIQPRLGAGAQFIGPVGLREKRALLAAARCVLIPSLVDETSSLVAMEALAAGTPVVAFPRGALPTIVDHGLTNYLVESVAEMADAIGRAVGIDPEACQGAARARFSSDRMTDRYLELYAELAAPRASPGRGPAARAPLDLELGLDLEEVHGVAALSALRAEWTDLWERCPWATPFQRPEWLLAASRHLPDGEPWGVLLRRQGILVGLAPLTLRSTAEGREVALLGAGVSDYLDLILDPTIASAGAPALLAHLASGEGRWDACVFEALRERSPLLAAAAPAGWEDERAAADVCSFLALRGAGSSIGSPFPQKLRKNLGYYRRRAAARGPVRFDRADASTLEELLAALVRLHGQRWSQRGTAGVLADPAVQAFHRDAAAGLLERGALRLHALRVGEEIVAALLGFFDKNRLYYYLSGFDPTLSALSAGTLIVAHAIEEALREGAEAFDFLRGDEGYKHHYGVIERRNQRRRLSSAGGREGT